MSILRKSSALDLQGNDIKLNPINLFPTTFVKLPLHDYPMDIPLVSDEFVTVMSHCPQQNIVVRGCQERGGASIILLRTNEPDINLNMCNKTIYLTNFDVFKFYFTLGFNFSCFYSDIYSVSLNGFLKK